MEVRRQNGIDSAEARAPKDPYQPAKKPRIDEDKSNVPAFVDAREDSALRIAAERVKIPPCPSEAHDQAEDDGDEKG